MSPVIHAPWPQPSPFQFGVPPHGHGAPQQPFLAGMREGARGKRRMELGLEDDPRTKRFLSDAMARELSVLSLTSPQHAGQPGQHFEAPSSPIASTATSMPVIKRSSSGSERPTLEAPEAVARDLFGQFASDREMAPAPQATAEPDEDASKALVVYRPGIYEQLRENFIPRSIAAAPAIDLNDIDAEAGSAFVQRLLMEQQRRIAEEQQQIAKLYERRVESESEEDQGMMEAEPSVSMQEDAPAGERAPPPLFLQWTHPQPHPWHPAPTPAASPAAYPTFWPPSMMADSGAGVGG